MLRTATSQLPHEALAVLSLRSGPRNYFLKLELAIRLLGFYRSETFSAGGGSAFSGHSQARHSFSGRAIFSKLYQTKNAADKIDSLLKLFEIYHLKNRVTGALSSGEKTRLNLAKCLLNDPKLLLLDEPTASLDPEMADTVRNVLKKIQKESKVGILYTSHNMPEVEAICDRIYFINEGKLIASGTPREVLKSFESQTLDQVFIKIVRSGDVVSRSHRTSSQGETLAS